MDTNLAAWKRCFHKRLFFDRADAEAHIHRLWAQDGVSGLEIYACEIGQGGAHFHVGHRPHNGKRRDKLSRLRSFGGQTLLVRQ